VAAHFVEVTGKLGIPYVFKASFDKANRSSLASFRGPGLEAGLAELAEVKARFGVPVITDVHEPWQAAEVAEVADILQLPAFLARQTDLVTALARTGKPINVKKPQFLAPEEMRHIIAKCREAGNDQVLLCERALVVDMRALPILKDSGAPVVFDASHAVQAPGGGNAESGGDRRFIAPLARAAVAIGVAGLFIETHPDPEQAVSDRQTQWPLDQLEALLDETLAYDRLTKGRVTPEI